MRCLYEVLDIDRDAEDAQIKYAYRKAALKWHPDKNQDNLREAEERFKELQNAYEVLSDKHERSWYDAHRHEILRAGSGHQAGGSQSFSPGQAPEDEINLYPYFSSTCFSGYTNDLRGFYGVYEAVFSKLAKQESEAFRDTGQDPNQELPPFGSASAQWAQVSAFYGFWLNFATSKSFAWADEYNPASAPNRKVRRLMEVENQRSRKAKKKEFNDTVRELAAFVRKRDKRVMAHQAEEAKRKLEQEAEERQRREQERRERTQRAREHEQAAWAAAELEEEARMEAEEDLHQDNNPAELFCVACDKTFRSQNALANHEKSKKHLERVEAMRQILEEEAEAAEACSDVSSAQSSAAGESGTDAEESGGSTARRGRSNPDNSDDDRTSGEFRRSRDNEATSLPEEKEEGEEGRACSASPPASESASSAEEDAVIAALSRLRSDQRAGGPTQRSSAPASNGRSPSPSIVNGRAGDDGQAPRYDERSSDFDEGKAGKKKTRRRAKERKSGRGDARNPAPESRAQSMTTVSPQMDPVCTVCGSEFSSRTKLFQHIKLEGHAALK